MRLRKLAQNYHIADVIAQLNLGINRRKRFIYIIRTKSILIFLKLLYNQGVIRTFRIQGSLICVYLKFFRGRPACTRISVVSKPSKRIR